jgi:S1-C subfamily serine protease
MDLPVPRLCRAAAVTAIAVGVASCGTSAPSENSAARAGTHRVNPSVVAVDARIGREAVHASGVIIDGDNGLVLTSAHDVWGANSLRVTTALGILHGRIVARAPCEDIAVLQTEPRIPGFSSLPAAPATGPADDQLLRVVGRVGDVRASGQWAMTGIPVHATGPVRRIALGPLPAQPAAMPLDTQLVPSVSGGAVVDANGRLVGMAQALRGTNRALLVPWSRLQSVLRQLHPGDRAVYAGWGAQYRCAGQMQAYALKNFPGYRRIDARLNAPVHATRIPGTENLDG